MTVFEDQSQIKSHVWSKHQEIQKLTMWQGIWKSESDQVSCLKQSSRNSETYNILTKSTLPLVWSKLGIWSFEKWSALIKLIAWIRMSWISRRRTRKMLKSWFCLIKVGYFRKNNPENARSTLDIDFHLWGKINGEKHLWGKMSFGKKCRRRQRNELILALWYAGNWSNTAKKFMIIHSRNSTGTTKTISQHLLTKPFS